MAYSAVNATITATGATDSALVTNGALSISGTWAGSITIQRQVGSDWVDLATYTSNTEKIIRNGAPFNVRGNVTSLSSGSIELRIVGDDADAYDGKR